LAFCGHTFRLVAIGVPRNDESKIATKITYCSLPHVVAAEPKPATP
jgi:hypothetical protein